MNYFDELKSANSQVDVFEETLKLDREVEKSDVEIKSKKPGVGDVIHSVWHDGDCKVYPIRILETYYKLCLEEKKNPEYTAELMVKRNDARIEALKNAILLLEDFQNQLNEDESL